MTASPASWPGEAAARALIARLSELTLLEGAEGHAQATEDLAERRRLLEQAILGGGGPDAPALVAFLGGTNVGKSTMFNHTVAEWLALPSETARGTRSPLIYLHESARAELERSPFLSGYERRDWQDPKQLNETYEGAPRAFFYPHKREALADIALIDSPDLDSNHVQNHRVAKDVLFCCDVMIFVTSNQKYRDEICERFLERASRLGKRIYVVFNYQTPKAVEDFRSRYKVLCGETLQDHRLARIDYAKGAAINSEVLKSWLPSISSDKQVIRAHAHQRACLHLPQELAPILERYRREVDAVELFRKALDRATVRRATDLKADTRNDRLPEMDEILALVMKELRVPGIDDVYNAVFETARGFWSRVSRLFGGGAAIDRVRESRERLEAERLRRHANAFVDDVREVFDEVDGGFAEALRRLVPKEALARVTEDEAHQLVKDWRDARRDVIEAARNKILADLDERTGVKNFIRAAKVTLRSASIVGVVYLGPQPLVDIAGGAAADLGLRTVLDKYFGDKYRQSIENEVLEGLEQRFRTLLHERFVERIVAGLPSTHSRASYEEVETAVASLRNAARELDSAAGSAQP